MPDRTAFLEQQRAHFRARTTCVIRQVQDERFQVDEDHSALHRAFNAGDDSVNFPYLVTMCTRKKIFVMCYDALRRMRNLDANVNLSRLPRLIRVHKAQMRQIMGDGVCMRKNDRFFDEMLDSMTHNLQWLRVITEKGQKSA